MISEMKAMWLMVMFDLPTVTKEEKKEYSRFRKYLLGEGFIQMQYSVYAKYCASRDNAQKYFRYIREIIPPGGYVRLLMITDKQFGEMVSLYGKTVEEVEKKPEQLLLF
ncbi:MAG: CRISPR-associated endonuclease Cas2 [Lentisphaeria bacterium]|nr:CRISPR-associated endonuclease Cas2 [Lentisphaeria bacterium]